MVDRFFNDFTAMHTIWHSLAWKEWHEHKWKLASVTAVLTSLPALLLLPEARPHEALLGLLIGMPLCIVPLALFIGVAAACGERSQGTLAFLQSLPIPRWRVALARLVAGLLTIGIAVLLTVVFVYGIVWVKTMLRPSSEIASRWAKIRAEMELGPLFDTGDPYADLAVLMLFVGTSVYVWTAATGVNRATEISAGAVSILIGVGWWLFLSILIVTWHRSAAAAMIAAAVSTAPAGIFFIREAAGPGIGYAVLGLATGTLAHLLLAAWYVWRYGRTDGLEHRSPRGAAVDGATVERLALPRQTALSAIVWKQWRESVPIAMVGLTAIAAILAYGAATEFSANPISIAEVLRNLLAVSGFPLALVVGVGVMHFDLRPQLNDFWRSRPIDPNLYYWTKLLTAAAAYLAAITAPLCFVAWVDWRYGTALLGRNHDAVLIVGLLQIAVYTTAVGVSCLVRNSVYSGILTFGAVVLAAQAAVFVVWIAIFVFGGRVDQLWLEDRLQPQIAVSGVAIAAIAFSLAGWQAFRRDWGWKG